MEGIYIFGGRNSQGKPCNHLRVIQLFCKPWKHRVFDYKDEEILGVPPRERWGHAMHFIAKTMKIVIYGGRNDNLYESLGSSSLEDICILDLKYMVWCSVRTKGFSPKPRYNFSSCVTGKISFMAL